MGDQREVTRRALFLVAGAAGAGLLTACAPSGATGAAVAPAPRTTSLRVTTTPAPVPSPDPPVPTAPAVDPAAVAARHAHAVPADWGVGVAGVRSSLLAPYSASGAPRVALTFDACGGPHGSRYDAGLIDGLRASAVPATLFLNARWIETHRAIAEELAADPLFLLANHGTVHAPLAVDGRDAYGIPGTRSAQEAVGEVWGNHRILTELTGAPPQFFRAGTAHYDDVAAQIVRELGETPIGFTVNGDGGATYGPGTVRSEFGQVEAGGIVLAHMNQPDSGTRQGALDAIADLRARGVDLVHVDG